MDEAQPLIPLPYASPRRPALRRLSRLALGAFLAAAVGMPALFALASILDRRGLLQHDMLCPNCGGWGAAGAVAATGALCIGSILVFVRTIWLGFRAASIAVSAVAVILAAVELLVAIAFYFAIQA